MVGVCRRNTDPFCDTPVSDGVVYACLVETLCPFLQALFGKTYPKWGSFEYTKLADNLGLGTDVVFGQHDRATLDDKNAEANIF